MDLIYRIDGELYIKNGNIIIAQYFWWLRCNQAFRSTSCPIRCFYCCCMSLFREYCVEKNTEQYVFRFSSKYTIEHVCAISFNMYGCDKIESKWFECNLKGIRSSATSKLVMIIYYSVRNSSKSVSSFLFSLIALFHLFQLCLPQFSTNTTSF